MRDGEEWPRSGRPERSSPAGGQSPCGILRCDAPDCDVIWFAPDPCPGCGRRGEVETFRRKIV